MVQQISDSELEIMKIIRGNPEKVTLFPYIMDGLPGGGIFFSAARQTLLLYK